MASWVASSTGTGSAPGPAEKLCEVNMTLFAAMPDRRVPSFAAVGAGETQGVTGRQKPRAGYMSLAGAGFQGREAAIVLPGARRV